GPGAGGGARRLGAHRGRARGGGAGGGGAMSPAQAEIQLIAVLTAVACALPGAFLVLRRMAMLSDAIRDAILLGIVAAFFLARDLASPLLVVGAALTGLATVAGVELLQRTRLVREDAATGLVIP